MAEARRSLLLFWYTHQKGKRLIASPSTARKTRGQGRGNQPFILGIISVNWYWHSPSSLSRSRFTVLSTQCAIGNNSTIVRTTKGGAIMAQNEGPTSHPRKALDLINHDDIGTGKRQWWRCFEEVKEKEPSRENYETEWGVGSQTSALKEIDFLPYEFSLQ